MTTPSPTQFVAALKIPPKITMSGTQSLVPTHPNRPQNTDLTAQHPSRKKTHSLQVSHLRLRNTLAELNQKHGSANNPLTA